MARNVHSTPVSRREVPAVRDLFDDFRLTLRQLRRSPGFLLTAVLTLTLAITANVVVAGVANGLLFHNLPVPDPQAVVQVQNPGFGTAFSYPNYLDLRDRGGRTFTAVGIARFTRLSIGVDGHAQPVWGFAVSGNFFQMLGLQPQLGRLFTPADDVARNGSSTLVLSNTCWHVRYHADPAIIGKSVLVGKHPFTVVGVTPPGFHGTEQFFQPDVWFPFHDGPMVDGYDMFQERGSSGSWVFGRLKPGISRAQADADLRRLSQQMADEYPAADKGTAWHTAPVGLLGDMLARPVRTFLAGVGVMSLLVLLAACANLGVLFSSRTLDRSRELGIRLAVGSSRARILRQLGTESLLIAAMGGAAAAFAGTVLLHALSRWSPPTDLPIQVMVEADGRIYLAAAVLAALTGLLFALLPARQIWRTDPNHTMRAAGTTNATADRSVLRSSLLVLQIALCCLLVTGAATAFRGLQRTFTMPIGFQPQGVTLASVDVALAGYPKEDHAAVQDRLLAAVQAIPGVSVAGYANTHPLAVDTSTNAIYAVGTTTFDQTHVLTDADVYSVSPTYFATVRTPLLAGRTFSAADTATGPAVAVINQTLAHMLFGDADPIGRTYPTGPGRQTTVVGLVGDGKYTTLTEDATAAVFRPMLQRPDSTAVLLARSDRPAAEMTIALRKAVASVDSTIPIFSVSSMQDALGLITFPARAATAALGTMGLLAAMLALTGIFGVASYTVTGRMRELGIRVALGAQGGSVLRAALGRTFRLLAIGSAAGLLLGLAATRLLAGIVYHASAADPVVLLSVVVTMAAVGAASAALPARRALHVEPSILLREQ